MGLVHTRSCRMTSWRAFVDEILQNSVGERAAVDRQLEDHHRGVREVGGRAGRTRAMARGDGALRARAPTTRKAGARSWRSASRASRENEDARSQHPRARGRGADEAAAADQHRRGHASRRCCSSTCRPTPASSAAPTCSRIGKHNLRADREAGRGDGRDGEGRRGRAASTSRRSCARRYALLGVHNIVLFAMSGIDMAAWDALGQALGQPLVRLLGAAPRPMPAYNSKGLGLMPMKQLAKEARELVDEGFSRGQAAPRPARRRATTSQALRAVKKAIGPDVTADDRLQPGPERGRGDQARPHDRRGGRRATGSRSRSAPTISPAALASRDEVRTPIQIGENFMGPEQMAQALAAGACDYVMPDARAHRRRHRLDARRGARAGRRRGDVEPPVSRR